MQPGGHVLFEVAVGEGEESGEAGRRGAAEYKPGLFRMKPPKHKTRSDAACKNNKHAYHSTPRSTPNCLPGEAGGWGWGSREWYCGGGGILITW